MHMIADRLLHALVRDSNVPPCDCRTAVLQKPLDKQKVVSIRLVDACGVPLAEGVRGYVLIPQRITHGLEVLLYGSLRDGDLH